VITVPAYFKLNAKQLTEKAGELAGLKVAQIAPEPVAAALTYFAHDTRDPLRIMTYDLGGGTFDVAILEKRDGLITTDSLLAFDGDRFLGGYNFDQQFALWMIEQLNADGYALDPGIPWPLPNSWSTPSRPRSPFPGARRTRWSRTAPGSWIGEARP